MNEQELKENIQELEENILALEAELTDSKYEVERLSDIIDSAIYYLKQR